MDEEDEGYMLIMDIRYPDNKETFINLQFLQRRRIIEDEQLSE